MPSSDARRSSGPHWYRMYGFLVRSDVPLPTPPEAAPGGIEPKWSFNLAEPGQPAPEPDGPASVKLRLEDGTSCTIVNRGQLGTSIWNIGIGTCRVSTDARTVDVYPEEGVSDEVLGLVLAGQVTVFILHQLGYPTIHASAVATEHGAVAFVGSKGQGKSTLAAYFLRQGATLLTDDVLPLELRNGAVHGMPSLPTMKVWPQTIKETLRLAEGLPNLIPEHIAPDYDKKLLTLEGRFAFAQQSAPLEAIYVLDRHPGSDVASDEKFGVDVSRLSRQEGLIALIDSLSFGAFLRPKEMAQFLPIYAQLARQATVYALKFLSGPVHQEAVYRRILEDLICSSPNENGRFDDTRDTQAHSRLKRLR